MSTTDFMLLFSGAASPWIVALLRRHSWSDDTIQVAAAAVAGLCFVLGQFADGALVWPLSSDFLIGLAAAFGLQQAAYQGYKRVTPKTLDKVERL